MFTDLSLIRFQLLSLIKKYYYLILLFRILQFTIVYNCFVPKIKLRLLSNTQAFDLYGYKMPHIRVSHCLLLLTS